MAVFKAEYVFRTIDLIVYLTMLGLGSYLINQGEVFQKYKAKKTNFAVYTEDIVELPTVVTYIHPWIHDIKVQQDFNISTRAVPINANEEVNLTFGENIVPGTNLRLEFSKQPVPNPQTFKIKPLNFHSGMPHDFLMVYRFRNYSNFPHLNFLQKYI